MDLTNIGGYIKPVGAIFPASGTAGTVTGVTIDVSGYSSIVLHGSIGSISGAPSGTSLVLSLNSSPDGTTWTAVSGAVTTAITAPGAGGRVNVDLSTVGRYIQAVATIAFVGGTSPAMVYHASVVLGGAKQLPTP